MPEARLLVFDDDWISSEITEQLSKRIFDAAFGKIKELIGGRRRWTELQFTTVYKLIEQRGLLASFAKNELDSYFL